MYNSEAVSFLHKANPSSPRNINISSQCGEKWNLSKVLDPPSFNLFLLFLTCIVCLLGHRLTFDETQQDLSPLQLLTVKLLKPKVYNSYPPKNFYNCSNFSIRLIQIQYQLYNSKTDL